MRIWEHIYNQGKRRSIDGVFLLQVDGKGVKSFGEERLSLLQLLACKGISCVEGCSFIRVGL